jgi:hypothetical protein
MVHFPPLPSPDYVFIGRYSGMSQSGFPHSEIPGSKPACGSPRLIAACHVLHRLLAPRHSPYALSSLTKCSLHLTLTLSGPRAGLLPRICGQKTTDCRIFSCQKTQKLLSAFAACQAVAPLGGRLVENTGIEPVTSWLQTRRSPS